MRSGATGADLDRVSSEVRALGLVPHVRQDERRAVVGVPGGEAQVLCDRLRHDHAVEDVVRLCAPFELGSREFWASDTRVCLPGGLVIGGREVVVIAGPCSVESLPNLLETAGAVRAAGGHVLRGGAFKPRTSPYSFQGLGHQGLQHLATARELTGLPVVTEVLSPDQVERVGEVADILQVGARSMQNFPLLRELGSQPRPVLLKRGAGSTVEEWLLSAEYILSQGNEQVILCERGIRSFETATRNMLDVAAVPLVRELSHLPVVVDPCHATGRASLVAACARAAVAAGADGVMVEVHPRPSEALSDGPQSLTPRQLAEMVPTLALVAGAVGRKLASVEAPSELLEVAGGRVS